METRYSDAQIAKAYLLLHALDSAGDQQFPQQFPRLAPSPARIATDADLAELRERFPRLMQALEAMVDGRDSSIAAACRGCGAAAGAECAPGCRRPHS